MWSFSSCSCSIGPHICTHTHGEKRAEIEKSPFWTKEWSRFRNENVKISHLCRLLALFVHFQLNELENSVSRWPLSSTHQTVQKLLIVIELKCCMCIYTLCGRSCLIFEWKTNETQNSHSISWIESNLTSHSYAWDSGSELEYQFEFFIHFCRLCRAYGQVKSLPSNES